MKKQIFVATLVVVLSSLIFAPVVIAAGTWSGNDVSVGEGSTYTIDLGTLGLTDLYIEWYDDAYPFDDTASILVNGNLISGPTYYSDSANISLYPGDYEVGIYLDSGDNMIFDYYIEERTYTGNWHYPWQTIPVDIDIKPGSCPNPINVKSKGFLPVAILGTMDFDVSEVDLSTVQLEGVTVLPLGSDLEDVATPTSGEPSECNELGPDGYVDLTLKFDKEDVITALGSVSDGDVVELTLTGDLLNGTHFAGEDCVVIRVR